jgi:hypothetical protein
MTDKSRSRNIDKNNMTKEIIDDLNIQNFKIIYSWCFVTYY